MDTQVQLVYMSRATLVFTQASLDELLKNSRTNNLSAEITGLLLYKCGYFLQVLEGPQARVDALYDRIRLDPRHDKVQLLMRRENVKRQFTSWSMAFVQADSIPTPGFNELLLNAHQSAKQLFSAKDSAHYVQAIIADFKNNEYHPRPQAKRHAVAIA